MIIGNPTSFLGLCLIINAIPKFIIFSFIHFLLSISKQFQNFRHNVSFVFSLLSKNYYRNKNAKLFIFRTQYTAI